MLRCDRNRCKDRPRCSCLVPVWSEFYVCCGYRCERCGGTLNFRRGNVPDWEQRKLERELFAKEGKR
jgi:hypothetical protein